MANRSPLFQSSIELLGHSIEHFNSGNELDRKLVILHLANAIELILKDMLLDKGISIYKNPKETITISKSLQELNDLEVNLPLLNKIELLIDERNALQHRYGSPNELTMIFYMDVSFEFFKVLLKENYGEEIEEILSEFIDDSALAAFKLRQPTDESELEKLKKVATVHPLGAYLSAMNYYENLIRSYMNEFNIRRTVGLPFTTHRLLISQLHIDIPEELEKDLTNIRKLRNMITHGKAEVTISDVDKAVDVINKFEEYIKELNKDEIKAKLIEAEKESESEEVS